MDRKIFFSFIVTCYLNKFTDLFIVFVVSCCSALNRVDLSGAPQLRGEGQFTSLSMKFDLSGVSQLSTTGKAVRMDIELSGAAVLNLQDDAESADLEVSGVSKLIYKGSASTRVDVSGGLKLRHE